MVKFGFGFGFGLGVFESLLLGETIEHFGGGDVCWAVADFVAG